MATFKVGQRVKRITIQPNLNPMVPPGSTGTILGQHSPGYWNVAVDGLPLLEGAGLADYSLAPLTDPRASEFIADMQRFAHVAKTTKVTA